MKLWLTNTGTKHPKQPVSLYFFWWTHIPVIALNFISIHSWPHKIVLYMLCFCGVSPRAWYIALSAWLPGIATQTGWDRLLGRGLSSSPAGAGGGTWPWPNILGNASTCWSPFLDWPVVLSESYVFCLIVKQTFLYLYLDVPMYHIPCALLEAFPH